MGTSELLDTLGKRVRVMRERQHYSQVELAEILTRMGIATSNSNLSKIEAGRGVPSLELLRALAEVLQTSADFLLLLSDNPAPVREEETPIYISPEADEVARILDGLSADARRDVLAVVQRITQPVNGPSPRKADVDILLNLIEIDYGIDARRRMERALLAPFNRSPGTGD